MNYKLGKHVKRITVWNEPVANLVELDTGTIIAIGYNRIVVANDLAAFKKQDFSWDRKWNYAGLDGGGKMAQFINDFYVQDTIPDHEMFDVVVLIDGSAIVITADLIAQFQNYVGVSPDEVQAITDHYIERPSLDAAIVERERMRLNWQAFKHESGASQWVEHIAGIGPFKFFIFENANEPGSMEPITPSGERPLFHCSVVWRYGDKTDAYDTAGETQASAVEVAKRRAVEVMFEQIDPLFDWITNELFLMKNEREN